MTNLKQYHHPKELDIAESYQTLALWASSLRLTVPQLVKYWLYLSKEMTMREFLDLIIEQKIHTSELDEFVKTLKKNLYFAKDWNSATCFVATPDSIMVNELNNGYISATLKYIVNKGKPNETESEILIGLLDKTDKNKSGNMLATKCKSLINQPCLIYKGYHEKDGADFAILLDIEALV